MKKLLLFFISVLPFLIPSKSFAQANHVVISEYYGGGGGASATYKQDYVELYNPTASDILMTSWSVQYASSAGAAFSGKITFTGTIKAKGFFLIQLSTGAGLGDIPTPDVAGTTVNASATAGRVALCNSTTTLASTASSGGSIVDFVGFGASAATFEGTGPTPAPSATLSVERKANSSSTNATMVSGVDQLLGNGYDSDQNATDLFTRVPNPQNSTEVEPVGTPSSPSFSFAPNPLTFGNQNISTTSSANSYVFTYANLDGTDVTLTTAAPYSIAKTSGGTYGTSLTYTNAELAGTNITVYAKFNPTVTGNANGTISHIGGGVTPASTLPLTGNGVDPNQTTFNFENCTPVNSTTMSDGFSQYSVTGAQTWVCTTFGHDATDATGKASAGNAAQVNGYASGNNVNEDWLISPVLNLSSMNFPILSFWTRNAFAGASLQLKYSTNYSGSGNPSAATWVDMDGKFPAALTDTWTKSDNIDLTALKASPIYIAFVYTSTAVDGTRWTLDDFVITNSATAPPVELGTASSQLNFGFQTVNTTSAEKTFTFSASNLTNDVTLTAPTNFTIAKTSGGTFSSSLTYTSASINNSSPTVYAKFTPTANSTAYSQNLTIATTGTSNKTIQLIGNSYDKANTLEVINWNIEWFGSSSMGPSNNTLQATNVRTVIDATAADIYGFAEVVDTALFRSNVLPPGYNVIFSDFGSYADDKNDNNAVTDHSYIETQKLAFMYRTDIIKPVQTYGVLRDTYYPALTNNGTNSPYKNWSSGRFPFLMEAKVQINGSDVTVYFIEIHAKANTGDAAAQTDAYNRRVGGNTQLKAWLDANMVGKKVIILGDYNDVLDLDKTIAPAPLATSSYSNFVLDNTNYFPLTLPLSQAGKRSTAGFNTVIDNVIVTKKMNDFYISNSAEVLDNFASSIASYGTTTTDHYGIQTRYFIPPTALPIQLTSFSATGMGNYVSLKWATASETNNDNFTIERSTNGKNFTGIKQVKGAGTSTSPLNYSAIDENPFQGTNYYRLKQTDLDGTSTYSDIKAVSILSARTANFTVYPNPVTDKITLALTTSTNQVNLVVSSVDGRILFNETGTLAGVNEKINSKLGNFAQGVYILKLTADGQVYKSKFIKQ